MTLQPHLQRLLTAIIEGEETGSDVHGDHHSLIYQVGVPLF